MSEALLLSLEVLYLLYQIVHGKPPLLRPFSRLSKISNSYLPGGPNMLILVSPGAGTISSCTRNMSDPEPSDGSRSFPQSEPLSYSTPGYRSTTVGPKRLENPTPGIAASLGETSRAKPLPSPLTKAIMVGPDPLTNSASEPAALAAAITSLECAMSGNLYGWWTRSSTAVLRAPSLRKPDRR